MQKGIKRAVRTGGIYYRVYKYHGEIMVSRGVITATGNFEPFNQSSPWLTQNPKYTMTLESGKVLCEIENDIPEAIEMVKNCGYESAKKGTNKKLVKNPTIEEAIELLKDGAHNHKDERYGIAYGMALGALKACDELLKKAGYEKTIEEAYDSLPERARKILNDLFCGNITISEYEAKIDELTREHAISYEFSTTETEFNVIRHAVSRLKTMLDIRLDPTHRYYGKQPLTTEERGTMETERAAARELIFRLDAVKGE